MAAENGEAGATKLLIAAGATLEAVNNVGPAAAARTARTPPADRDDDDDDDRRAPVIVRNSRNRRIVTLARAGIAMTSRLENL